MSPTTAHRGVAVLLAAILLGLFSVALAGVQLPVPAFRITALRAMLFYGQSGAFSPDVFGPSAPTLQNVRTGVGQSSATFIVIEITGRADSYVPTRKIEFTAMAEKRSLLNKTLELGRFGEDGKIHAGFWLYDTGCVPVVLKARIVGQADASLVQKTINFKCGD